MELSEGLNILIQEKVILAIISGIGASLFTFLLSSFLTVYISIRDNKKNNRAFLSFEEKEARYDTYPLTKESPSKVIETEDYKRLLRNIALNKAVGEEHDYNVTFGEIKNLGPGTAIQLRIGFRLILTDSPTEEGWRVDVNVPILEKGERVLVPLLKFDRYQQNFYIADAEISYITQANEKMKLEYSSRKSKEQSEVLDTNEVLLYRQLFIYRKLYKSKIQSSRWVIFYEK
ncbi:MAG: hypothetical protein LKI04_24470 [Paenibacillus lautus]|uniref:hypothetical protein n=1 Tax=Paenibacillus lautus TaxID=1401 RepID=UPI0026F090B9|nr:hypothetical protein [Paenibacillus lautus]MCI1777168.1 hypothetical protein [Paenibacillus lautus]